MSTSIKNIRIPIIVNGHWQIESGQNIYINQDKITSITHLDIQTKTTIDGGGRLATPALIDCHTHLVYAGNRAHEFEMRLNGKTYQEIALAGGGIQSTVSATQNASFDELFAKTEQRLLQYLQQGVGTIEIKSGYGQNTETEIRQLQVARALAQKYPIRIITSFLGAHACPKNMTKDEFIDYLIEDSLPKVKALGLADAVDGFCENIGFSPAQIKKYLQAATDLGFRVKLHAEQLSNQGGASLLADFDGLSADHLEYIDEAGVQNMKKTDMVAVLLPGAFYYLRETTLPPIDLLRKHQVSMAIATDSNPGSCPMNNILLAMNMAATLFRLTPIEIYQGVTHNAAKALGLAHEIGSIQVGYSADIALWNASHPNELIYPISDNLHHQTIFQGNIRQGNKR